MKKKTYVFSFKELFQLWNLNFFCLGLLTSVFCRKMFPRTEQFLEQIISSNRTFPAQEHIPSAFKTWSNPRSHQSMVKTTSKAPTFKTHGSNSPPAHPQTDSTHSNDSNPNLPPRTYRVLTGKSTRHGFALCALPGLTDHILHRSVL